jgi:hypothetical protein
VRVRDCERVERTTKEKKNRRLLLQPECTIVAPLLSSKCAPAKT